LLLVGIRYNQARAHRDSSPAGKPTRDARFDDTLEHIRIMSTGSIDGRPSGD
jgi:hypothetical protein